MISRIKNSLFSEYLAYKILLDIFQMLAREFLLFMLALAFQTLRTRAFVHTSRRTPSAIAGNLCKRRFSNNSIARMSATEEQKTALSERSAKIGFDINDFYDYKGARKADETKEFVMQQTMIRVKDPKKSLEFYVDGLGFSLIMHRDFPQWEFSVYFVAQIDDLSKIPTDPDEQWNYCMNTPGCIEVTWNYGTEEDSSDKKVYNTGNSDGTGTKDGEKIKGGFGHLGITVPDVYKACERFHELGMEFVKSPNAGGMKGLAFVKDPDGYLIEILPQGPFAPQPVDCLGVALEGGEGYKDNSK